eukprot:COSAG02_NODE_1187_length_14003_cov_48.566240_13_plen_156_part_00
MARGGDSYVPVVVLLFIRTLALQHVDVGMADQGSKCLAGHGAFFYQATVHRPSDVPPDDGLCVLRGRQVVSVVVLNTCLFIVLLSNAREGGGGEESRLTAKGVPNDGKRSPQCYPQEESPFFLKEESHWPPWDSVLKRSPMALNRRPWKNPSLDL